MSNSVVALFRTGCLLAGCLTGLLAEGFAVLHYRAEAARSRGRMEDAVRELRRLDELQPQPSPAMLERSEAAREAAMKSVEATRSAVLGRPSRFQEETGSMETSQRAEAYFDLARFADGLTELCLAEDIEIPAGLRFGFASHASVAPAAELIPQLLLQSTAIEDLVAALVATGPRRIESVRRERPSVPEGKVAHASKVLPSRESGGDAADYFTHDTEGGVARKLGFGCLAFRVGFIGTTATLRHFLNHLARCDAPWCVTAVEAKSLEPADRQMSPREMQPTGAEPAGTPLRLTPLYARYVVTAEWIQDWGRGEIPVEGEASG